MYYFLTTTRIALCHLYLSLLAMVYARAPPSFQARYFSFRPPPIASPLPFGTSPTPSLPMPTTSALSPNLGVDFSYNASIRSVSPSNFRPTSLAPSVIGSLTCISLNHKSQSFPFLKRTRVPVYWERILWRFRVSLRRQREKCVRGRGRWSTHRKST